MTDTIAESGTVANEHSHLNPLECEQATPVPVTGPHPKVTQRTSDRILSGTFIAAVFLSSTLLFLVQPLVARLLLPLAGGSAALWNTAMVFFQVALLAGYAYAHGSIRRAGARKHTLLQTPLLLLPLLVLPISVPTGWVLPNDVAPSLWVLLALTVMVGLPFFALATTSPTLQVWFSSTNHPRAEDPYFLYAAGNIGSVLALLGYPLFLEPMFSLQSQTRLWAAGYALFVASCIAAGWLTRRRQRPTPTKAAAALASLTTRRRLRWLFWGFVPSALMLGVTLYISTDLASFPLLWVLPLLLYLVTFIVAFGKDSATRSTRTARFVTATALPLVMLPLAPFTGNLLVIGAHLVWFFMGALLCHSRLADDRPAAGHLTEFYLILSIGGALGGIFASLLAPVIFVTVVEYPIAIALVLFAALEPASTTLPKPLRFAIGVAAVAVVGLFVAVPSSMLLGGAALAVLSTISHGPRAGIAVLIGVFALFPSITFGGDVVHRDRSFFGVYIVRDGPSPTGVDSRMIISGTTTHGVEVATENGRAEATSYYFREGPVGQVMAATAPQRVGIVGLGAGSIAAYAQPGDEYVFWEIDQLVVDFAEDPDLFTYLSDAQGSVEVILDDGRHGLAVAEGSFDLIVIDAFGSDAIPVHLMTAEAIQLYVDRLAPGGTIMIHISNRHFELAPVVANSAAAAGADAYEFRHSPTSEAIAAGAFTSHWMAIPQPGSDPRWAETGLFSAVPAGDGTTWTDDYANVLGALKLGD